MSNGSWRVDETYVRVKGRWTYLYRAVDSRGQTIDFLLSARRDTAAARRFFRKAAVDTALATIDEALALEQFPFRLVHTLRLRNSLRIRAGG